MQINKTDEMIIIEQTTHTMQYIIDKIGLPIWLDKENHMDAVYGMIDTNIQAVAKHKDIVNVNILNIYNAVISKLKSNSCSLVFTDDHSIVLYNHNHTHQLTQAVLDRYAINTTRFQKHLITQRLEELDWIDVISVDKLTSDIV